MEHHSEESWRFSVNTAVFNWSERSCDGVYPAVHLRHLHLKRFPPLEDKQLWDECSEAGLPRHFFFLTI